MAPLKVIVQGIPTHQHADPSAPSSSKADKLKLEEIFRAYGPVTCVYMRSIEQEYANYCPVGTAKRRKVEPMEGENFAHLIFMREEDGRRSVDLN